MLMYRDYSIKCSYYNIHGANGANKTVQEHSQKLKMNPTKEI